LGGVESREQRGPRSAGECLVQHHLRKDVAKCGLDVVPLLDVVPDQCAQDVLGERVAIPACVPYRAVHHRQKFLAEGQIVGSLDQLTECLLKRMLLTLEH
jgi:hypothetical protein